MTPNITVVRTYEYLSEALAFYLLFVLFFYFNGLPLPFWSYLAIVAITKVVYSLLANYISTYIPFLVLAGVIASGSYFIFYFPLIPSVLLAAFLTWRFISHEIEAEHDNQHLLLVWTLIIVLFESMFMFDEKIVWMIILQIGLMIFGHIWSQSVTKHTKLNRLPMVKLFVITFSLFAGVSVSVYLLFDAFRMIVAMTWKGISHGFLFGIMQGLRGLELLGVNFSALEEIGGSQGGMGNIIGKLNNKKKLVNINAEQVEQSFPLIQWAGVGLVVLLVVVVIILVYKKKILKDVEELDSDGSITMEMLQNNSKRSSWINALGKPFHQKPSHPARQLFFDFERFAWKRGYGRLQTETIEDWFERLGMSVSDVELYQQVRYGDRDLSSEEIKSLKQTLKETKEWLVEKGKEGK